MNIYMLITSDVKFIGLVIMTFVRYECIPA